MAKNTKNCLHKNTMQVGTELTIETWCTDCNEIIEVAKPKKIKAK